MKVSTIQGLVKCHLPLLILLSTQGVCEEAARFCAEFLPRLQGSPVPNGGGETGGQNQDRPDVLPQVSGAARVTENITRLRQINTMRNIIFQISLQF